MAFLGERGLCNGISGKLLLSMAFLELECLSMAFHGFSLNLFTDPAAKCGILEEKDTK